MVENEPTGERVDFVVESADLLRMEVTWSKPGHRSVRHAHPEMEERWTVLEGRAAFEIDGVLVEAGPDRGSSPRLVGRISRGTRPTSPSDS